MLDRNRRRRLPRARNVFDGILLEKAWYITRRSAAGRIARVVCSWRKTEIVDPTGASRWRSRTGQSNAWMVGVR